MKCKHGEPIPSTFGCNGCDAEKAQRKADNLQRREYAKAVAMRYPLQEYGEGNVSRWAEAVFNQAESLLTEQKKREDAE